MQRQAVPLITTEAPVVGTGMETKAAVDSGVCVVAKKAGTIESSESNQIIVKMMMEQEMYTNLQSFQEVTSQTATIRDQSYSRVTM